MEQETQQTVVHSPPPPVEASAYEWVQLWMPFLLLVVPLWIGYKSLKLKREMDSRNAVRRAAAEELGEEPPSDETIMRVITSFKKDK